MSKLTTEEKTGCALVGGFGCLWVISVVLSLAISVAFLILLIKLIGAL